MFLESSAMSELTNTFRSLSTKRRQGVLEVRSDVDRYEIIFVNGRIVSANQGGRGEAKRVCERLVDAGCLIEGVLQKLNEVDITIAELRDVLVEKKLVEKEALSDAVKSYELDLLHSLRKLDTARCEFTAKIIHSDPDFSLSISPGQLLLDLVEIETEEERYLSIFGSSENSQKIIAPKGIDPNISDELARRIWNMLGTGMPLGVLVKKLISPRHEIRVALLHLLDSKLIEITEAGAQPKQAPKAAVPQQTIAPAPKQSAVSAMTLAPEVPAPNVEKAAQLLVQAPSIEEEIAALVLTPESEEPTEQSLARIREATTNPPSPKAQPQKVAPAAAVTPPKAPAGKTPTPIPQRSQARSLPDTVSRWNVYLLEPHGLEQGAIAAIAIFLFFLALFLPGRIESMFSTLSNFSSAVTSTRDTLNKDE